VYQSESSLTPGGLGLGLQEQWSEGFEMEGLHWRRGEEIEVGIGEVDIVVRWDMDRGRGREVPTDLVGL